MYNAHGMYLYNSLYNFRLKKYNIHIYVYKYVSDMYQI